MKVRINDKEYEFDAGKSILDACSEIGLNLPTFCHHELLEPRGVCRLCVVEADGKLVPSCATKIREGMSIETHSNRVIESRRMNLMLLIADHQEECLSCNKSDDCLLFKYANEYDIHAIPFEKIQKEKFEPDESCYSFRRDLSKCIKCGKCVEVCNVLQKVYAIEYSKRGKSLKMSTAFEYPIKETECTFCGQCVLNCPTCALEEKYEASDLMWAINDKETVVACQVAPSIRASIMEEFGKNEGITVGKLVSALKMIGFDYVFDTQFGADLTIMEEANELLERIKENKNLPMFTSCCPAWVKFVEDNFQDFIPNLSSCKSPQQMLASVFRTYFAGKLESKPENIKLASIMPCTAKKTEARRYEFIGDIDFVVTTRELARMIKEFGIEFEALEESEFDCPLGESSGAGAIFGVSGGVCEAALRTAYETATSKKLEKVEFEQIRGVDFFKHGEIEINGKFVRFAVVHTLGKARDLLEQMRKGEAHYDFVEVMACPGGCIGGGGQPIPTNMKTIKERMQRIYTIDQRKKVRRSHENPDIIRIYGEFLEKPLSKKAHALLHTKYMKRSYYSDKKG